MPEYDEEYEDEVPVPRTPNEERDDYKVNVSRRQIRRLEASAKTADEDRAGREAAERELAFARAGVSVDPDDARAAIFRRGYNGELTPDAIRTAATEFGVGQPAPPTPA